MGNFYTNYTLRGPSQQAVAAALAGRSALVTPEQDGFVFVFDEESEKQNFEVIAELASLLSRQFCCPLLAVLNHDDGLLWYQLYLSGELADDYNSTPNYFEPSEEDFGPVGGDAQKICSAFGVDRVGVVESILRKPTSAEDGYLFASERHADLSSALGMPPVGVSAGYDHISIGELPEGLEQGDLLKTKDLVASEATTPPPPEPVPGYYKVSFRAHPKLTKSIPSGWMPALWADLECSEPEVSEQFLLATGATREAFRQLGFVECGFKKLRRVLNPNFREHGGINYLDKNRSHFAQLIYNRFYFTALDAERETLVISFSAVFDNNILSCTNNNPPILDELPNHRVVRLQSNDVSLIYHRFLELLREHDHPPRLFPDLESLKTWFDSNAIEMFKDKVRRGIWVRMSDYEVAVAQSQL